MLLQANVSFEVSDVCEGTEAIFLNNSTVAAGEPTYEWSFGDGNTSNNLAPTHLYDEAKTYNVTLTALIEGGCDNQTTNTIQVVASPDANFTVEKNGRSIAIDGPSGNDIYRWTFGDGGRAQTEDTEYTYINTDLNTFTVCLATKKGTCWSENCEEVNIDLVGVKELSKRNDMINVYPNPTVGKFTVAINNPTEIVVKVGDILGNVLDAKIVDNYNGTYSIDLLDIADGVYFVQVKNGDYFATKRIRVSK